MLVHYMKHACQDIPKFFEVDQTIRNNVKIFTYCVKDKGGAGMVIGKAEGTTKKDAENQASLVALRDHYGQTPS